MTFLGGVVEERVSERSVENKIFERELNLFSYI